MEQQLSNQDRDLKNSGTNRLDRRELLVKTGAGAGAIGLSAFLGGPLGAGAQGSPTAAGTLIEGGPLQINALAPIVSANRLTLFLFDTLVFTNPEDLQPQPNLASSWTWDETDFSYTFTLAEGATFHDGAPVTSADVKFTFDLLLNEATASPYYSIFAPRIAAVEALTPETAKVTLTGPIASFLNDLSGYSIAILPQHLLADVAPEALVASEFAQTAPVGSGPYRLKEYRPGEAVILEANENYFRGAPQISEVVFKLLADTTVAYQQLVTGEVDVAAIGADFYEDAQTQPNFTPVVIDTFALQFIGYNLDPTTGAPGLAELEVRQAIAHAIDRELIVERIYSGLGLVAPGTQGPVTGVHAPDEITTVYNYDPEQSKAILDAAGWVPGSDGIRAKGDERLAFELLGSATRKTDEGLVLAIQEFLAEVGIEVTPRFETDSIWNFLIPRDFQAAVVNFTFAPDPDQSLAFSSTSTFNVWGYNNPTVDELLAQGLVTTDPEARRAIYVDLQNAVVADLPVDVLFFDQRVTGVNNRVSGYLPTAVGYYWARQYDAPEWTVS